MKKHFAFLILIFFSIAACNNPDVKTKTLADTKINNLKSISIQSLNGAWVLTDYIQEIEKTKSPALASKKLVDITSMAINSENQTDSVAVSARLNNHEGYSFAIYATPGKKPNTFRTSLEDFDNRSNYFEIGNANGFNDSVLCLFHYNKNNQLIDSVLFTRVKNSLKDTDPSTGLQYAVNKSIVAGNYNLVSKNGTKISIALSADGKISGLSPFNTYYITTDFIAENKNNLNEICFDMTTPAQKCFAFTIEGSTINIFNTVGNEDEGTMKAGKLLYTLVRQ